MENREKKATPTTFRVTPITNGKFKELAQSLGLTQDEMLGNLISSYELENAKALIVDREKEIEEFQSHSTRLINIYLNSLELNQNSELRIQERYNNELNKKLETINLLQEKIKELKEDIKNQDILLTDTLNENSKVIDKIATIKDTLNTKENLIDEYKGKIDTLTSLVTEYTEYKNNYLSLKAEYENSLGEKEKALYNNKELCLEKNNLEKRIELLDSQIKEYKEYMEQSKIEYKENIRIIREDHKSVINDKNNELERVCNEHNREIQVFQEKSLTEASRCIVAHKEKLAEQKSFYEDKIKELKEGLENIYTNKLDKATLKYEKVLFEKDKEINKLKKK